MLSRFWKDEAGMITVETVVMVAAVTAFGMATVMLLSGGVENVSTEMAVHMAETEPGRSF